MSRNQRRRYTRRISDIPTKANRVLNIILIAMVLILLRVWHLGVIQHQERLDESRRPQQKIVVESAKRGTIRDRYNIPLAINKIQYNATILYSQIKIVPAVVWEKVDGKKTKRYKRREYIRSLAEMLAKELNLDADRLVDLIHSKASLYNSIPYTIKEDLSETEYYHLKMLEKDWVGLQMSTVPKRYYPMGKVGGDIVGYMGAISRAEYESIIHEIKDLELFLLECEGGGEPTFLRGISTFEQAQKRYQELVEHAYSINDYVGKAGIEGRFEENLRGYQGKTRYYADAQGNFLHKLSGEKDPLPGQRVLLSISAELQQYAEELLVQNERIRSPRVALGDEEKKQKVARKQPWIKGGAIVAMDPHNGDILALASAPRFDPNDFIASGNEVVDREKKQNIRMWFETDSFVAEVWDQKRPLEREMYDIDMEEFTDEKIMLNWQKYLDFILPEDSPIKEALVKVKNISRATRFLKSFDTLLSIAGHDAAYPVINYLYRTNNHQLYGKRLPAVQQEDLEEALAAHQGEVEVLRRELDVYFKSLPHNYDKVFFADLCRLVVDPYRLSNPLLASVGEQSLSEYREASAAFVTIEETAKKMVRDLFVEHDFKPWREENQKVFLKEKRLEEKKAGIKYPKPYLDIIDRHEKETFDLFWDQYRWQLLATFLGDKKVLTDPGKAVYHNYFSTWHQELSQGAHRALPWRRAYTLLQRMIKNLDGSIVIEYLQSLQKFDDLTYPLYGRYRHLRKEPGQRESLGKHLAAAFYPAHGFGFARSHAYRQASTQGSIFKLITAYESLNQRYQKLEGKVYNEEMLNPLVITDDSHKRGKANYVGYDGAGKPIPQLYKGGRIPRSHRSGLGKMDVIRALELSSNPYFSLLAVDYLDDPNDLARAANDFSLGLRTGIDLPAEISGRAPNDLDLNRHGLYALSIGQHSLVVTPLQTAVMMAAIANGGQILKPRIVNMIAGKSIDEGNDMTSSLTVMPTVTKNTINMPPLIRKMLIEGMDRVARRTQTLTIGSLSQLYRDYPEAISDLVDLKGQLVGKSSTAESMETIDLDLNLGTNLYNHIWFGGIVYQPKKGETPHTFVIKDPKGVPELVVVVYLRYGAWGKDATPLAAQVAEKWRQIKKSHQ